MKKQIDYLETIKALGIHLIHESGEEYECDDCDGEDSTCESCEGTGLFVDTDTVGWRAFPGKTGGCWGECCDTLEEAIDSMLERNGEYAPTPIYKS
ncbi:hypothetical protein vBAfQDWS535_58 [Alcaligenes phage vB_Af_QDWS535]|nr:hypothetical protein vBAfQDWS535_58 [Alcaligenes phage vB_Af_QDWS535]